MYLKLSIRNARRSFTDYLLYVAAMTVLVSIIEISNCITIIGEFAGFQVISLPLFIGAIQIILVGYIDAFMLKQRAKEFASYLLLGMEKKRLTRLFLCEVLLIGFCCYIAGTTIGFSIYGLWYFREPLHGMRQCGFLYGKSMFYTFLFFCLIETVCSFRLRGRLNKLQIRELMYERNCGQSVKNIGSYKKWGILFFLCFVCFIGCVFGIVFWPEVYIVYPVSVVAIPLIVSVFAFYRWVFGYLYAYRRMKPVQIYQKDRLYITANITSNFKTAATVNAVFCICFLFSGCSFVTGMLMLQPEFQLFDTVMRQWMGASQISICIVFLVIYFSILSLQQIIEVRQNSKGNQIMRCMGKSNKQIAGLVNNQIAIRLISPMIMALLTILFCIPLLNGKMNLILPVSLNNILLKLAGGFGACIIIFYICYFGIICVMSKRYINASHDKQ
ncbi:FtsX-like permease family protein [bacterium C-53]|nr:FtsX-like permease family protein [Lachnospiraceae bacterium]NBI04147.1 FtsX-like permease family protein [Lachnospiraceae bacterium]RKJ08619.1 FtsX-like permease family protein [bacterium C-53]